MKPVENKIDIAKNKTTLKKHMRFVIDKEKKLFPVSTGGRKDKISYFIKKVFQQDNILMTILSYRLQLLETEDLKPYAKYSRLKDYWAKELPIFLLEYKEFWEEIKGDIYTINTFGLMNKASQTDIEKLLNIKVGRKKVNIDGKISNLNIYLGLTKSDLLTLSKDISNSAIPVEFISYGYKSIKHPCSYGVQGLENSGFIVSSFYKKLLRPDKINATKILSYFQRNSSYPRSIKDPILIEGKKLHELINSTFISGAKINIKVFLNGGQQLHFINVKNLLMKPGNENIFLKILDNQDNKKSYFISNSKIYLYNYKDIKNNKDAIIKYLLNEELDDFLDLLNSVRMETVVKSKNNSFLKKAKAGGLDAVLMGHQQIGSSWLWNLYSEEIPGALLADEMGVGKTVQTIAFLSAIGVNSRKRVAIICPASVVPSWENELNNFNPKLAKKIGADIQIMSYEKAATTSFKNIEILVLDEVQKIKNNQTKTFKKIALIEKKFVVLLSGTPIENKIEDLISVLQIIDPSAYDLLRILKKAYPHELELAAYLKNLIEPIYLRRSKSTDQVTASFKTNFINVSPSNFDMELQKNIKKVYSDKLLKLKAGNNHDFYQAQIMLTGLMRLRQALSYPSQLPAELLAHFPDSLRNDTLKKSSNKEKELFKLYKKIKNRPGNEKVVIFSMFSSTITHLADSFRKMGSKVFTLQGTDSIAKRKDLVKTFQDPSYNIDVFIISLKAGNSGITLTAANNVIIYDLWYNPAVIAQALARVHRIGQTKDVNAYIMVTKNTVDERINEIFLRKQDLIKSFENGHVEKQTSKSALMELGEKIFKGKGI